MNLAASPPADKVHDQIAEHRIIVHHKDARAVEAAHVNLAIGPTIPSLAVGDWLTADPANWQVVAVGSALS